MNKELYMEYLDECINENAMLIDKLNVFIENATYDVEIDALLEASGDEPKDDVKKKNILASVGKAIVAAFNKIIEYIKSLIEKLKVWFAAGHVKATKDITISKYVLNKFPSEFTNILRRGTNADYDNAVAIINKLRDDKITIKEGARVNIKPMGNTLVAVKSYIADATIQIRKYANNGSVDKDELGYLNFNKALESFLMSVVADCNTLASSIEKADLADKVEKNAEKNPTKAGKKAFDESAGLTRNEYIASIMLEAADLLREDGEGDMADGATNLVDTDIKDIPDSFEETPEVDDEYCPSIVGGDPDEEVDPEVEEHIKELCDGDQEVMDILTKDNGGAVIDYEDVPATEDEPESSNESINFWW